MSSERFPLLAHLNQLSRLARATILALCCNLVFAVFLLVRPLPHPGMMMIGDPVLTLGLFGAALLPFLAQGDGGSNKPSRSIRSLVPYLLALGVLCGAVTAGMFGYYDLVLRRTIPPGSLADLIFFSAHPFALLAILMLPSRRLLWLSRARVVADGMLVLAAAITFSWFFILGPIMVQGHQTLLQKASQGGWPLTDLVVIVCLFMLLSHFGNAAMRPAALFLSVGLAVLVITDSVFDYQRLHNLYAGGSVLDIGWLCSGTMVGLAALALRLVPAREHAADGDQVESRALHLWHSLVPYALVLSVAALTLGVWSTHAESRLAPGVYIGAVTVTVLVLFRQLLAIFESGRLYDRLDQSYRSMVEYANHVQRLNEQLSATRDALEENNQALAEANVRLEELATHDALTGLPNRVLFHDHLEYALATARRSHRPVAVVVLDLDHFKDINDTFGHQRGDTVLQNVAGRLEGSLRAGDTVARIGGDEFALCLPEMDEGEAESVIGRIIAALSVPTVFDGVSFEVGGSFGLALYPEHADDAGSLLRSADTAMYIAKRERGGYAIFSPEHDRSSLGRVTMTAELRRGIAEHQLLLHYQPKIDLRTRRLHSVEALVRWHHPVHGFMRPDEFIPLAEHTGLIRPLTEWVLQEAYRQSGEWRAAGVSLPIAINLSAQSLHDDVVLDAISSLLKMKGRDPDWLQIEITESGLMADPERARQMVLRLHDDGVRIAIDDFGTGYSSLAYLKRLPVAELKIDKSFVQDMLASRDDQVIVRSVVDLGHNLGLEVVAEGVEDEGTIEVLCGLGCDVAQGYFFSRPVPAADLSPLLDLQPAVARHTA